MSSCTDDSACEPLDILFIAWPIYGPKGDCITNPLLSPIKVTLGSQVWSLHNRV